MTAPALQAFEAEGLALGAELEELEEKDFDRPTQCLSWTVKELVVHLAQGLTMVGAMPATTRAAEVTAVDLYRPSRGDHEPGPAELAIADICRRADIPHDRQRIVEQAQAEAAGLPDGAAAARLLRERWRDEVSSCDQADLDSAVETPFGVVRRIDLLLTRLMAHAVHGYDLAVALDREPWLTRQALAVIRPLLVTLLGAEPPTQLDWTDLQFFTIATGRRQLADEERAILGEAASRFPLIS